MMLRLLLLAGLAAAIATPQQDLLNITGKPKALRQVSIEQRLGQPLPLDAVFRDELGNAAPLKQYFHGKPVILAPVYFDCPMLCTQILSGLVSSLKGVTFNAGKEFEVIAFSFDPVDTPAKAQKSKMNYLRRYGRPGTEEGFHFLTGQQGDIEALTKALGFYYSYDPQTKQFAHASAVMIATPEGRLSRYFYGVEYAPRDVRFGLIEAADNKIGNVVDQAMLFCFHYDPSTGKYGPVVVGAIRLTGTATVLLFGGILLKFWRRDIAEMKALRRG